jgi:hypothetical protein
VSDVRWMSGTCLLLCYLTTLWDGPLVETRRDVYDDLGPSGIRKSDQLRNGKRIKSADPPCIRPPPKPGQSQRRTPAAQLVKLGIHHFEGPECQKCKNHCRHSGRSSLMSDKFYQLGCKAV